MNILVIGSEGFIGSHCASFFHRNGHNVLRADVKDIGQTDYFCLQRKDPHFETLFANTNFDVCINASGSAHVSFSFEKPETDYELNVLNVHKILVAIRKLNPQCRFINFSSAAVYGNPYTLPIKETFDVKPLSPYGFHKLQSEYLLTEYHKFFGLHTCSIRIFSAYGPRLQKQIFWDLYSKAQRSKNVELFGTGEESRDFIYIDDLLELIHVVIEKSVFMGEVINAASGVETKIKDVVKIFYSCLQSDVQYKFSGQVKVGDPNNWKADISLANSLGFKPKYDIEMGIKKYVEWIQEIAKV